MAGVVYTKEWVADFILDLVGYVPQEDLAAGVAVEPSCGCGAFLAPTVRRLSESAKRYGRFNGKALRTCIRAYDIDEEAVEASRVRAAEVLAEEGLPQGESRMVARSWISAADALLVDAPRADWVVGNPPYVRSAHIDRALRQRYARRFGCATMGTDLYVGFFEMGLRILKADGKLCFICADRWLQNRYGTRLRALIAQDYRYGAIVRMHGVDAFQGDVSAYPAIVLLERQGASSFPFVDCMKRFDGDDAAKLAAALPHPMMSSSQFSVVRMPQPRDGSPIPLCSPQRLRLVSHIEHKFPQLEETGVSLGIGIASGCDDVFVTADGGVVEADRLLPLFSMRDWRKGVPQRRFLVNPWGEDGELVDLERYPLLARYFEANEGRLRERRVARDHPGEWYRTLDRLNPAIYGREALLFPDLAAKADPVLSDGARYPHHNCYWLTSDVWKLRVLGGLLMSDMAESFVDAYGVKMRGGTLRFQAQYLRQVHVPRYDDIDARVRRELAHAFETRNRGLADAAARKAFDLLEEAA